MEKRKRNNYVPKLPKNYVRELRRDDVTKITSELRQKVTLD